MGKNFWGEKMNRFILGDAREELARLQAKVDCIITDPPYGIGHSSKRRKDKSDTTTSKGIVGDVNNMEMLAEVVKLLDSVLKNNSHIYWFTRWDKIAEHYPLLSAFFNIKNIIIWDKKNRGSGDLLGSYGNRYECIIYGMKGRRTLNEVGGKKRHDDIIEVSKIAPSKLIHPHQKPIELLTFLIEKSTIEGEIVLDPFAGVASTLVAAKKLGRKYIGIEIDEDFYRKGEDRLNDNAKL